MKYTKPFIAVLSAAIIAVGIMTVMPAQTKPQPASAQEASEKYDGDCTGNETLGRCADKPFDHNLCQYPTRTTNPVDGCDNSDPCDPANVKGGSGECNDSADQPNHAPIVTQPVSQCGGTK